jgi:hypothetical protein
LTLDVGEIAQSLQDRLAERGVDRGGFAGHIANPRHLRRPRQSVATASEETEAHYGHAACPQQAASIHENGALAMLAHDKEWNCSFPRMPYTLFRACLSLA